MEQYSFHLVDGAAIAIFFVSGLFAFIRGFVREVLGIISWVLALFTALYAHEPSYPFWSSFIDNELLAHITTFGVVFIGVLTTSLIIAHRLSNQVGDSPLNSLDRTLGLIFGFIRGAVILSLAYVLIASFGDDKEDLPGWFVGARSIPLMETGAETLIGLLPETMQAPAENAPANKKPTAQKSQKKPAQKESNKDTNGATYDSKDRQNLEQLIESVQ